MSLTLGQAKDELANVAGISGMSLTHIELTNTINRACAELLKSGDHPESVDRYQFTLHDGFLVLPHFLEKATHVTINRVPMELRSPWFEFVQHGPGIIKPEDLRNVIVERGRIPGFRNVPLTGGPWQIKLTGEVDESVDGVEPIVHLRGYDENKLEIYSTGSDTLWGKGEDLTISRAVGFTVTSSFNYSALISLVKPVTKGRIFMDATDGVTDIRIGEFAPEETTPYNRVYLIPGVADCEATTTTTLDAEVDALIRAKRSFVKAIVDEDLLQVNNIDAIETMIIAQEKRKNQNVNDYVSLRTVALGLMADESAHTEQRTKRPFISFGRTAGFNYPRVR